MIIVVLLFVALPSCLVLTTEAIAVPQIHVDWGLPGDPVEGLHYTIDASDPDFPDIELITGDTGWNVWSRDSVTGAVSDIGDITAFGEADYTLILTDDYGNPAARDVLSIVLTPGVMAYLRDPC